MKGQKVFYCLAVHSTKGQNKVRKEEGGFTLNYAARKSCAFLSFT